MNLSLYIAGRINQDTNFATLVPGVSRIGFYPEPTNLKYYLLCIVTTKIHGVMTGF